MNDVAKHECEFDPERLLLKLDFQLPGDVESIQPAVDEIMEVVGLMECAAGNEFEVEVALARGAGQCGDHTAVKTIRRRPSRSASPARSIRAC